MDLETLIVTVFCLVDDFVRDLCRGRRLRQRGPTRVLAAAVLAPANEADLAVAPQLLAGLAGWALGDKGYWSPVTRVELAADGPDLIAPPRGKNAGVKRWPVRLVQTRRRIETVLSQL